MRVLLSISILDSPDALFKNPFEHILYTFNLSYMCFYTATASFSLETIRILRVTRGQLRPIRFTNCQPTCFPLAASCGFWPNTSTLTRFYDIPLTTPSPAPILVQIMRVNTKA